MIIIIPITFMVVYGVLLGLMNNGGNITPDRSPLRKLIEEPYVTEVEKITKNETDYFLVKREHEHDDYLVKAIYKNKRKTKFDFEMVSMSLIEDDINSK